MCKGPGVRGGMCWRSWVVESDGRRVVREMSWEGKQELAQIGSGKLC